MAPTAKKISGEAIMPQPAEWCSPQPYLVVAGLVGLFDQLHVTAHTSMGSPQGGCSGDRNATKPS
jgi:hypothetical protein